MPSGNIDWISKKIIFSSGRERWDVHEVFLRRQKDLSDSKLSLLSTG